jgi:uncharacterized repeat protein (TIGR03843 family)
VTEPVTEPVTDDLACAPLEIVGRIMPASNQTFLCRVGDGQSQAVYKPVAGERPLWDFTTGTLAEREYAAWLVSEALGWDVVPRTLLRDGPHGFGMVQQWCEVDPAADPVDLVRAGGRPPGYLHVLDAEDDRGRDIELCHEDSEPLLRMAVFDVVVNNTDRKGGHVLAMPGGHRHGVDHGICFHPDDKLRTVLWGFAGRPLGTDLLDDVTRAASDATLLEALEELLTVLEVERFVRRAARLVRAGTLPSLGSGWPAIPWPPF